MANASAPTRVFERGDGVLDYWLARAEGFTVEPLGARVEEVRVARPSGRAETLIVRWRLSGRTRAIPAGEVTAVDPSRQQLVLTARARRRIPRPSPERTAAARNLTVQGARATRKEIRSASHLTAAGAAAATIWLRPRAAAVGRSSVGGVRIGTAWTIAAVAWLTPRVLTQVQAIVSAVARGTVVGARTGRRVTLVVVREVRSLSQQRTSARRAVADSVREDDLQPPGH